jgi:predicted amidophosphoribosyltransferase
MLLLLPVGLLFRRAPRTRPEADDTGTLRIRCPLCSWEPGPRDRWMCSPGCGHLWNTFDTRGVCPACAKHWLHTACHACSAWSLHEAWYEHPLSPPQ